ncbi:MAG: M48 family metallopeptidase [Thermoanaerobaculia bacterium]|nr:M48 family metallopeptidase [Thermoanaerobaculia bacterium]
MSSSKPISTRPIVPLLLAAILATACASTGVNRGDVNLVSLEEEWELGRRLESDLARELDLVRDPGITRYVSRLGQEIVNTTEMARYPWEFHVVRSRDVNAFNIPGGHVYVNTGLIAATDSASELAGVMAHEIAHGVARHGTEQLTKAYGLNILAGLALGQNPQAYEQILAQILGTGAMAKFSRDDEREADYLGVHYMARAGYHPEGMVSIFRELLRQRQRRPSSVERFFASHPLTEERIRSVRSYMRELGDLSGLTRDEPAFRLLHRRVGG